MPRQKLIDIQGHRGARGLYPENTLTAFIEAVKLGVSTLELDVVISGDGQVLVSHEAWMNSEFCSAPDGSRIEAGSAGKYNLFKMTYSQISTFDCGGIGNPAFPFQKKVKEHKPLLREVFVAVETYTRQHRLPGMFYNIEIKTEPRSFNFNPPPDVFSALVYKEISDQQLNQRCYLQSFDSAVLQCVHQMDPEFKTGLLVENSASLEQDLARLGFVPYMYNPEYNLVDNQLIHAAHAKNMLLIPWTVNETSDMERLLESGVDGIITDYPDRALSIVKKFTR